MHYSSELRFTIEQRGMLTFILKPALALVSINMIPDSRAFLSPSSIETCLFMQNTTLDQFWTMN